MTCSTCGNALGPDVRFCPRCGTQIPFQPSPAAAHASAPYTAAPYGVPYDRVTRNL